MMTHLARVGWLMRHLFAIAVLPFTVALAVPSLTVTPSPWL